MRRSEATGGAKAASRSRSRPIRASRGGGRVATAVAGMPSQGSRIDPRLPGGTERPFIAMKGLDPRIRFFTPMTCYFAYLKMTIYFLILHNTVLYVNIWPVFSYM
jgi:hypothetical protein